MRTSTGSIRGMKMDAPRRHGHNGASAMNEPEKLIPLHGGYRKLKSFQVAQLVYDVTVRFCKRYVDSKSRTRERRISLKANGSEGIGSAATPPPGSRS